MPATALKPGDSYVQSFARGLEVIRAFSAQAPRQTLTEVAARTGLTRAGARRILLTLQTLGYVESDGKLFALTPRILDLGFAYLSSMPIWNLAEPVMEALVDEVKESCSAAVLDALHAKTAIANLSESVTNRLCRVIGGGTFHRASHFGAAFEDVRALGFLRPPWVLAYDQIVDRTFAEA